MTTSRRQLTSQGLFAALSRPAEQPPAPAPPRRPRRRDEENFTAKVISTAQWHGWKVTHFRPSRTASGRWATAVQGDIGSPDLLLARHGDVILAELKTDDGRLRPEQRDWLTHLGPIAVVWRPRDWDAVLARLAKGPTTR
ncbi:hypothetical protein ACL02T_33050 [Pseudonocardia sp. RS010]|uniref:hypothetical protein n=1 Tax=Pseudonocardia sp. RS010 TaxID=3385979 RepID=UPI0039A27044